MQRSLIDISRAYFNAKTDAASPTYVSLPQEDEDHQEKCGLLLRHMYGTRAPADGWQEEYSSYLVEVLGFKQGATSSQASGRACVQAQSRPGEPRSMGMRLYGMVRARH